METEEQEVEIKKVRPPRPKEVVAARVQDLVSRVKVACAEGVQPLNRGCFQLEAMRAGAGAKRKDAKRRVAAKGRSG